MAPNMDILCEITNNKAAEDLKKLKKKSTGIKGKSGAREEWFGNLGLVGFKLLYIE